MVGGAIAGALVLRDARPTRAPSVIATAGDAPREGAAPVTSALGPAFPAELRVRPVGDPSQSKLWFHDGRWWGVLLAEREFRVHSFDPGTGWKDSGVVVDTRPSAHVDVLAEGDKVTTASAGRSASERNAVEIRQYEYDRSSRLYRSIPGFPVRLTATGAADVTIDRTKDGRLWTAFVSDRVLQVARTGNNDLDWSDAEPLPVTEAAEPVDGAALAANGDAVAVVWSTASGAFFAATSTGGAEWVTATLLEGAAPDAEPAITVRAGVAGGPRFVALLVAARPDAVDDNLLTPEVLLLANASDGRWKTYEVARAEDGLSEPTLAVDAANGRVVVLASAEGSVWLKEADAKDPVFGTGRGQRFIPADVGGTFDEVTTARALPAGVGIIAVAADNGIGRYAHGFTGIPGVESDAGRADRTVVVSDNFDGRSLGSPPPPGWELTSDAGTGALDLVRSPRQNALRLTATDAASEARACRSFATGSARLLNVSASVRFSGAGSGDATLLSVRGGAELASVRVAESGRLAWFNGATKEGSDRSLAPGTWYAVEMEIDLASRTYDVTVREGEQVVASAQRLTWRVPDATTPDAACISTRQGRGAEIATDDVEVRR